jgi:hypothetical protein
MKLLQKSEEEMSLWIKDEAVETFLAKSKMSDEQKAAIKAAMGELNKAKSGMDEEEFKAAHSMLAKLLGFGKTEEKKAAPAPEPVEKKIDALPAEIKAEFVALQKSRDEDRKALEELQKSVEAERETLAKKELVTKAALEFGSVPMDANKLGELLFVVRKSDPAAGETLLGLLKGVNEAMRQSALFADKGTGGESARDKAGVVARIEAQASELVTKSATPLTKEQAFARVLETNPALYTEYLKTVE